MSQTSDPVDVSARLRAAARAADRTGWIAIGAHFQDLAFMIQNRKVDEATLEAIAQALTGKAS